MDLMNRQLDTTAERRTTLSTSDRPGTYWPPAVKWSDTRTDSLLDRWVAEAMKHAKTREVDPGCFVAEVPGVRGAWIDAPTSEQALDALPDVLFDWARLAVRDRDADIPVFGSIDLNP